MRLIAASFLLSGLVVLGHRQVEAQGRPDPAQIFSYIDGNQNGRLDPDEIENARGPLKDRLRAAGVDYSKGISREEFGQLVQRMRESGDGRGRGDSGRDRFGRGGPDRGAFDDERRDGRDGFDRSRFDRGVNDPGRFDRFRDEERREDESRPSGGSTSPTTTPRVRVTVDLQETFREGDDDFDGQIGLYEWRKWKGRGSAAEFARLDVNRDGFITPREITRAASTPSEEAVAVAASASRPSTDRDEEQEEREEPDRDPAPTPASSDRSRAIAAELEAIKIDEDSPDVRRYRSQYKLLDRDGDGYIKSEEWERSTKIRGRMTEAGVDIREPMDADTFVKHLVRLDTKGDKG